LFNFKALPLFKSVYKMEASSRDAGVPVSSKTKPKKLSTPPRSVGASGPLSTLGKLKTLKGNWIYQLYL
jgi:hypothetical protein